MTRSAAAATLGRANAWLALLLLTPARSALAHVGPHDAASWTPAGWWTAARDAGLIVPSLLLLLAGAYALGVRRLWLGAGRGRGVRRWRVWCYDAGLAMLGLALVSPLDAMSETLVSAHMVQHMLLIGAAPPLIVLGLPGVALPWAMPRRARRTVAAWWRRAGAVRVHARRAWKAATAPALVWLPHALVLWSWHAPAAYEAALRRAPLHALEHATFLATAMLLWWSVIRPSRRRRARDGAGFLVVALTMLQTGALGALLAFATRPWYVGDAGGTATWGLTPLEDQQWAGLIMWIPGGMLYLAAAVVLFLAWIGSGPRTVASERIARRPSVAPQAFESSRS